MTPAEALIEACNRVDMPSEVRAALKPWAPRVVSAFAEIMIEEGYGVQAQADASNGSTEEVK